MDEVPVDWDSLGNLWTTDQQRALDLSSSFSEGKKGASVVVLLKSHVDDKWVAEDRSWVLKDWSNQCVLLKKNAPVQIYEAWVLHRTMEAGVRWELDDCHISVVVGRMNINPSNLKLREGPFSGDADGYVYHSTHPDFLDTIKEKGLPGSPDEPSDWDPDEEITPRQVYTIFVTESFCGVWADVHLRFPADVIQSLTDKDGSELAQDPKALDLGTTDAWRLQMEEPFTIPPDQLQVLEGERWTPLSEL
jgi:hypothetical protein